MASENVPTAYNQVSKQGSSYLRLSAGRACQRCRQQRVRCDLGKPCNNCVKAGEECKHVDVSVACFCCSRSKVKCDKQRPCARCVKRGKPEECFGPEIHDIGNEQDSSPVPMSPVPMSPVPMSPVPTQALSSVQSQQAPSPLACPSPVSAIRTPAVASSCNHNKNEQGSAGPSSNIRAKEITMPDRAQAKCGSGNGRGYEGETVASEATTPTLQDEEDWAEEVYGNKKRKWDSIEDSDEEEAAVSIYPARPLKFQCTLSFHDLSKERGKTMLRLEHTVLRRMWDAGYNAHALLQLFNSLPSDLRQTFHQGLEAMEFLNAAKMHMGRGNGGAEEHGADAERGNTAWMSKIMDEDDGNVHLLGSGLWTVTLDPRTSRRLTCHVNVPLGEHVIGMHPEEMLSRAGHSELSLPHSQLEFFCNMMDDVLTATQPVVTRYVRVTRHRQGRVVDSLLVRRKVRKSFNGRGQLVSVRNVITPVTPHEYDQALRMDPTVCRPLMRYLDDFRSGQDLLDDANRDILFEESFQQMAQQVEGISKLSKLNNVLRANFEPYIRMAANLRAELPHLHPSRSSSSSSSFASKPTAATAHQVQETSAPHTRESELEDGLEWPADFGAGWSSHGEQWSCAPSPLPNTSLCFQANFASQSIPRSLALRTDPLL